MNYIEHAETHCKIKWSDPSWHGLRKVGTLVQLTGVA